MPTGPSSTAAPYLLNLEPNAHIVSIITAGDALAGSTSGVWAGIPDGIGAFDNGDGTMTVVVNHEMNNLAGAVRDHGSIGAFVETLVVDQTTLAVISGHDTVQSTASLFLWDDTNNVYTSGNTTAFSRFCSGDLASPTAYFDTASGLGTSAHIYLTGEESGPEGRATAWIIDGPNAGTAYELPMLGNLAFENLTANPFEQTHTIVAATDDGLNGQVYFYVGEKQNTGTVVDRAGLTNGNLYGVAVAGIADETNGIIANGTFTLEQIADAGNLTGAQIDAASEAQGITSFLRPEDSAWDPDQPNVLYFTTTNGFGSPSRLYRLTFTDITNPALGGTIEAVLDGTEGQQMFDNLTVANGKVILQEDPGNQPYVSRMWEYDIATDTLTPIVTYDPAYFTPGQPGFITQDEETSGVIDVTDLLGDADTRAYLLDAQLHTANGNPLTVEPAQLLALYIDAVPAAGTIAADVLNGDGTANTMRGLRGADTLNGGSGDDSLLGGTDDDELNGATGADTLSGGWGSDVLIGGAGGDVLLGGGDADYLSGEAGQDALYGGAGNDTLLGGADVDYLAGGAGDDSLDGGTGADQLAGGLGNDVLLGGSENDTLAGGAGDDTITGGTGADSMTGGLGADTFVFAAGDNTLADRDLINSFNHAAGDLIDLTALGLTAGDIQIVHTAITTWTIDIDSDGDTAFDMGLTIISQAPVTIADFSL